MLKIAIAEDITKIAHILKEKVEMATDFEVVFTASNGREMIRHLQKDHSIDIILMDINMPEMNGLEATTFIHDRWPNIKIIMSTVFDDDQNIFDAIMAGAIGYLMKDEPPAKIHRAIYEALEGGAPMSTLIAKKSMDLIKRGVKKDVVATEEYNLTPREIEILGHLAKGLSYEQIADNLFISYGTVRKHVENIYRKLKVNNKIVAVQKAKDEGLL